jgi:hypothetical protein
MQRFLDRFRVTNARAVQLGFVDRPVSWFELPPVTQRMIIPTSRVFLLRCPVVSAPELRPYLTTLGSDALANALDCSVRGRKP